MALIKEDVVRQSTDLLKMGLRPFVERNMREAYGQAWESRARCQVVAGTPHWDLQALLKTILDHWQIAFEQSLPRSARNLVFELKEWRNHIAHEHDLTLEDTARFVDTAERLLRITGAPQRSEVEKLRLQVFHAIIANETVVQSPAPKTLFPETTMARPPIMASNVSGPMERQVHVAGAPSWQICVDRLGVKLGDGLKHRSGRLAFSADGNIGVCCLVSKEYEGRRFWWNLRERHLHALADLRSAYVAFACGLPDSIVSIPLNDFIVWLPTFNPKPGADGAGWHIHMQNEGGRWWLLQSGRDNRVDVTELLL